jgi:hypothetical protein
MKGENNRKMMGGAVAISFIRALASPVAISLTVGRAPLAKSVANAMMLACNTSNTTISPEIGILADAIRQRSSSANQPAKRLRNVLTSKRVIRLPAFLSAVSPCYARAPSVTPNGEVEGPRESVRSEPRVHTVFPHPRRHYRLSRPPPTIVRRTGATDVRGQSESFEIDIRQPNQRGTKTTA